jgi:hypothetical protein
MPHRLSRIAEVDLIRIRQNTTDRALALLEHLGEVAKVGRLTAIELTKVSAKR